VNVCETTFLITSKIHDLVKIQNIFFFRNIRFIEIISFSVFISNKAFQELSSTFLHHFQVSKNLAWFICSYAMLVRHQAVIVG